MSKPELIILDWDGVVTLDSTPAYDEKIRETLMTLEGVHIPETELTPKINNNWGKSIPAILGIVLSDTPHLIPRAIQTFRELANATFADRIRGVGGVAELLGALSAEHTLAINTAASRELVVDHVMPKLGIDPQLFKFFISAEDLKNPDTHKPDPATVRLIMRGFREIFSRHPNGAIMVGDSASDVLTAYYSGIEPVVPLTGNLDWQGAYNLGVRPNHIIKDLTHIWPVLNYYERLP
jgi:beta-phosphoglucomutase-like phosphatase (HAD superfamily)